MKKLSILALGIIVGITLSISFSASADTVKQYVLTKIGYPIIVNGQEYADPKLPALNYNGTTYLPLKGVGDVLGTAVKWNEQLKRVEVGGEAHPQTIQTPTPTPTATPQTLVIKPIFGTVIFKIDGKSYTPYQSIFMWSKGNDNKFYINSDFPDSIIDLLLAQNKEYIITPSDNPYLDGVLTPKSAGNLYERNVKYLGVTQQYTEVTFYNPIDRNKFYFMSNQPGKEVGLIKLNSQYFIPADEAFSSLDIKVKIEMDEEQHILSFTLL